MKPILFTKQAKEIYEKMQEVMSKMDIKKKQVIETFSKVKK